MKKMIALGALLLSGCSATQTKTIFVTVLKSSGCHAQYNGKLPDPQCTPGVVDPSVTQQNIHKTICVPGYSKSVRPSTTYTDRLKIQQIASYGLTDTNPHLYEEDHLISLELGGAPKDPQNLWPEFPASPNPKDKVENYLHRLVCDGVLSLAKAQHEIAANWTTIHAH